MKQLFFFIFCCLFSFPAVAQQGSEAPWEEAEGDGTLINPWLIRNAEDLKAIATHVNDGTAQEGYIGKYFAFAADIAANGDVTVAIGTSLDTPFRGCLDGRGYSLSINVETTANKDGYALAGLFGYLGEGAVITNVNITGGTVTAKATNEGDRLLAGGIAAAVDEGAIVRNCVSKAVVTCEGVDNDNPAKTAYVGNLVAYNLGRVTNCVASGEKQPVATYIADGGTHLGTALGMNGTEAIGDIVLESKVSADYRWYVPKEFGGNYDENEDGGIYKISTAGELAALANIVNGTVPEDIELGDYEQRTFDFADARIKQTANIDLKDFEDWTPIGIVIGEIEGLEDMDIDLTYAFRGSFTGNGYTISNLQIKTAHTGTGLFGATSTSKLEQIVLSNVNIEIANEETDNICGAVVGGAFGSTITLCSVSGGQINVTAGNVIAGGLVGLCYPDMETYAIGSISNCYTTIPVSGKAVSGSLVAGGAVGISLVIANCYASGNLAVDGEAGYLVGGVSGVVLGAMGLIALNEAITGVGSGIVAYARVGGEGQGNANYGNAEMTFNEDKKFNGTINGEDISYNNDWNPDVVATLNSFVYAYKDSLEKGNGEMIPPITLYPWKLADSPTKGQPAVIDMETKLWKVSGTVISEYDYGVITIYDDQKKKILSEFYDDNAFTFCLPDGKYTFYVKTDTEEGTAEATVNGGDINVEEITPSTTE